MLKLFAVAAFYRQRQYLHISSQVPSSEIDQSHKLQQQHSLQAKNGRP